MASSPHQLSGFALGATSLSIIIRFDLVMAWTLYLLPLPPHNNNKIIILCNNRINTVRNFSHLQHLPMCFCTAPYDLQRPPLPLIPRIITIVRRRRYRASYYRRDSSSSSPLAFFLYLIIRILLDSYLYIYINPFLLHIISLQSRPMARLDLVSELSDRPALYRLGKLIH